MLAVTAVTLGVVWSRMEAVLLKGFAVAKSGFWSPLKSSMLTEAGLLAGGKGTWGAKVGVGAPVGVVLSRMEAVPLPEFAVAKSSLPSPLMSPMLTALGLFPVGKVTWGAKLGVVGMVVVVLCMM